MKLLFQPAAGDRTTVAIGGGAPCQAAGQTHVIGGGGQGQESQKSRNENKGLHGTQTPDWPLRQSNNRPIFRVPAVKFCPFEGHLPGSLPKRPRTFPKEMRCSKTRAEF